MSPFTDDQARALQMAFDLLYVVMGELQDRILATQQALAEQGIVDPATFDSRRQTAKQTREVNELVSTETYRTAITKLLGGPSE